MNVKRPRATRRDFVKAAMAVAGVRPTTLRPSPHAAGEPPLPQISAPPKTPDVSIPAGPPGLGEIAASRGRRFGAAVQSQRFVEDPAYGPMVDLECGLLMPDYETKMAFLQPKEGVFNFRPVDTLIAWARAHNKPIRGHGLIWHQDLPDWVVQALAQGPDRARALMNTYIGRVFAHTQGEIGEWDVVNEVVADPAGSDTPQTTPGELRDSPWLRALGPDYIPMALRMAKERDPSVRVVLNEYGLEEAAPHHYEKRRRFLNLVRSLRRANVPLDAVGLQGHMQIIQPFSGPPFTEFCRLLRNEGVDLVVTEMDIREHWKIPDGFAARDKIVADRVRAFMDAALDGGIKTFVTWGLEDKYSWLASEVHVKRQDGLEHRGLPLDDDGHRKPYWLAMADAFRRLPPAP
jgi:endo-1,4-beta-xylanase